MPIEINELIIKATVGLPESRPQTVAPINDNEQKVQKLLDDFLQAINEKDER